MRKKRLFVVLALLVLTILLVLYWQANRNDLLQQGNKLVRKIENFRSYHKRLPENLTKLGIPETTSGPLFYDKKDSLHYIVWFGVSLGESKTYHSDTGNWEDLDR